MTETMTSVLHELCTQLDQAHADLARERQAHSDTDSRRRMFQTDADRQRERADVAEKTSRDNRNQLGQLRADQEQRAAAAARVLGKYDRLTLDLYHYIVELAGHRDTAKTKAERVALGHVVERLADIRGMNDSEREAIG